MKELQDLIAAWRALPPSGKAVLATVVETTGSTYRKPGARMLITEAGWVAGSISGGCLESDVLATAWDRTASGPALVIYDSTAADDIVWGFGLGCQGSVTVLFERLGKDGGVLPALARCIEAREPIVVATVVAEGPQLGQRFVATAESSASSAVERKAGEMRGVEARWVDEGVFYEGIRPPLAFTIFGAGHDAVPLVAAAQGLGWYVTVVDHRPAFADATRFPGARVLIGRPDSVQLELDSAAVIMTHNYETDVSLLGKLLPMPLTYLGQLGPRARTARMLADLVEGGYEPSIEDLTKLYAPIGLDLGGDSPEAIALAIVAEVQAIANGATARSLRGRYRPTKTGKWWVTP